MDGETPFRRLTRGIEHVDKSNCGAPSFDLGVSQIDSDNADLPKKSPHVSCYVEMKLFDTLKQKLSSVQLRRFMGTCFGQYANMPESWVQSQILRCAMSLELKTSSTDAIILRFNENTLRFSLRDFAIISGLNCVACKGDFVFDTSVPNRLMQTDFDGEEEPYKATLFQAFEDKDFIKKSSVDEQGKISSMMCIVLLTVAIIQRDCGVFIIAYAKYLIHEKDIRHGYFDAEAFRTHYAALLWQHGTQKNKIDVVSDDESPDRPVRPQFECESSDMIIIS
ncbi:hypothetical protein BC332_03656 [Capsicum chinense]|nr:hypothetical protein BC332_03656 [Capsicum chinense]